MKTTKRKTKTVEKATPAEAETLASASASESASRARVIALASHCTVKDAAALKLDLCAIADEADVTLDVGAVERIDTATMQLLCAFVRDRSLREQKVTWKGESECWRNAVRVLGAGELLGYDVRGAHS